MEVIIKLNSQTSGRDKIARLLQYMCRAVYDSIHQNEINLELIEKLKSLEYILSSFRKLLRFGKCSDIFYSTLTSIHYPDSTIRLTLTLSKIAQSLYLFADHFIWLARSGLFPKINLQKWNTAANKYWLFSIVMNLIRDAYEISRLIDVSRVCAIKGQPKKCQISSTRDLMMIFLHGYTALLQHKDVLIDTIKNLSDVFIPLTALGYIKLTPRMIGILGVISSLAGIIAMLYPAAKLVPM